MTHGFICGARDRNRTGTVFLPRDFKSFGIQPNLLLYIVLMIFKLRWSQFWSQYGNCNTDSPLFI